ncbi:MAG: hypothetical protein FWF82_06520 [Oscillospiraceae bacterium]|nr:hypothetical protein [Oscillospiraceae bacterium]
MNMKKTTATVLTLSIILTFLTLTSCKPRQDNDEGGGTPEVSDTSTTPETTASATTAHPDAPDDYAAVEAIRQAMKVRGESASVFVELTEYIDGERVRVFKVGENSEDSDGDGDEDKFTALYHYAVSDSGKVYYMDVVEEAQWVLFDPEASATSATAATESLTPEDYVMGEVRERMWKGLSGYWLWTDDPTGVGSSAFVFHFELKGDKAVFGTGYMASEAEADGYLVLAEKLDKDVYKLHFHQPSQIVTDDYIPTEERDYWLIFDISDALNNELIWITNEDGEVNRFNYIGEGGEQWWDEWVMN